MRVLLIGDSCTDVYVYGDVKRLNPEAPVPILEPKREDSSKGMAWNVFDNLKAFGLSVFMLTNEEKIIKTRYIHEKSNQQILRVDNEPEIKPLPYEPPFMTDRSAYHKPPHQIPPKEWYDVMVISDYDKGYVTQEKLFELPITSTFQVASSFSISIFQTFELPVISKSKSNLSAEAA